MSRHWHDDTSGAVSMGCHTDAVDLYDDPADLDDSYDVATCLDCDMARPTWRNTVLARWWRDNDGLAGVREVAGIFLDAIPIPGRKRPQFPS